MVRQVVVGEIAGPHGIKGWVKVHSHTDPPENILDYSPWVLVSGLGSDEYQVVAGRSQGKAVVAQLQGVNDRNQAEALKFRKIVVSRDKFPAAEPGHYYWIDLLGLKVTNIEDVELGVMADMLATGANDVMIVRGNRERLIPFVIGQYVRKVDLESGIIQVDWDPDF